MKAGAPSALEKTKGARNYEPMALELARGKGVWVWDTRGKKRLDMMGAYSAVSFGHGHPKILRALTQQARRLAVCSRAYTTDTLGPFLAKLCAMTKMDRALPMNTGAEAVETAIKCARRWGEMKKGIAKDKARIAVARGNFHGRTTTIIGFSSEEQYRAHFGPFAPGFDFFDFGSTESLKKAIGPDTAAVLLEPVQGEAGIIPPPAGWLKEVRALCDERNVLLILDEVQSGFGRTGRNFAFERYGVKPDAITLGKALGGGLLPVSAFCAKESVMDVFEPGSHGSTFGGNPLAAAVGLAALETLEKEKLSQRAKALEPFFFKALRAVAKELPGIVKEVRGVGLWAGVELHEGYSAPKAAKIMADLGVLTKDTHHTTLRFAPPLTIGKKEILLAASTLKAALLLLKKD